MLEMNCKSIGSVKDRGNPVSAREAPGVTVLPDRGPHPRNTGRARDPRPRPAPETSAQHSSAPAELSKSKFKFLGQTI
ncbi:unnamed protein product [Rhodiola kirilowii]